MSSFTGKSTVIHECTNLYYKQLKSVHKVRSNYGNIFVLGPPVKLGEMSLKPLSPLDILIIN